MTMLSRAWMLLVVSLAALAAAGPALADDQDLWYVVQMQGKPTGWMNVQQKTLDGKISTASTMKLTIKRGTEPLVIEMENLFIETVDGKPVSARASMTMASRPTITEYTFADGKATVSRSTGGKGSEKVTTEEDMPEGTWLTPAASEVFATKRLEAGAQEFTMRVLDVSQGLMAVTTTTKVLEKVNVEAMGKTVPGIKLLSTTDIAPGIETVIFADEQGEMVRSEVDMGGISMTFLLADKELAQAEVDAPELMASTLVKPKGEIDEPRMMRKASYLLKIADKPLADLPSVAAQRVERVDANTLRVRVDLDEIAKADEADEGLLEYRQPSQMIEVNDEVVARLTRDALEGIKEDRHDKRVEALRRSVFKHIKNKNFGVGFASAAEVARTCEGDCSEHAALLTAMLRNAGYAARTASGLVYVEEFAGKSGIFGYHMWSQVLLDRDGAKRWIDLDATMPSGREMGEGGFDATHIILATASLKDGESINALVVLAPLIGKLEITVE